MNTPAKNTLRLRLAPGLVAQIRNYIELTRLNKPIGIWLLLWPTLWALWLAGEGHPDPGVFVVFVVGVIVMRSAGCVLNDFADRNIDPYVERTRASPIATRASAMNSVSASAGATAPDAIGLARVRST